MIRKIEQERLEQLLDRDYNNLKITNENNIIDEYNSPRFLGTVMETFDNHKLEAILCVVSNEYNLFALSAQTGCIVGCNFCNMSRFPPGRSLSEDEIIEELSLLIRGGIERGYPIRDLPSKIAFVKGGEALLNENFPDSLKRLYKEVDVPVKISTTFPHINKVHKIYERVLNIAEDRPKDIHLQISLLSTDEKHRQDITKATLSSFEEISGYGDSWRDRGCRNPTLTFTLTKDTPCEPNSNFMKYFPHDKYVIKLRGWVPNNSELKQVSDIKNIAEVFQSNGYNVILGGPDEIERKERICTGYFLRKTNSIDGG